MVLLGRTEERAATQLELARRQSTFEEVTGGLDESTALYEARRCLSCGNCFSCDNCYGVCPDNAVIKLGKPGEPYAIDYDYCKGCGICAAECPCGAIAMVPERSDDSRPATALGPSPGLHRREMRLTFGPITSDRRGGPAESSNDCARQAFTLATELWTSARHRPTLVSAMTAACSAVRPPDARRCATIRPCS